ncbi:P1 family peptidase [Cohaesibacter celericrescens]|uniref:P1 family peptidase n=1 Tax=Cohaesibacter celericrescens TaxID=2067669 RepID=UPI00356255FF
MTGTPVGKLLQEDRIANLKSKQGSIIVILTTDIPLSPGQLERLARRTSIGISKSGSPGSNGKGDIFFAFSTANEMDLPQLSGPWRHMTTLNNNLLDPVYMATVEAVDEVNG